MVIVCPNCSVSYHIEPHTLGPRGRTVRCAGCRHSWHVPGADGIVEDEDALEAAPEPVAEAEMDAESPPAETLPASLPATVESLDDVETAARREMPASRRSTRVRKPKKVRQPWPMPRPVTLVSCLGILSFVAAISWRDVVVTYVPDTAAIFRAIGLPANPRGLAFANLTTSEVIENGVPMLIVTGNVENIAQQMRGVPRLRLAVHGTTGREIYVWTAMPARTQLLPGETLTFWSQLASPPVEGREVSVRFLGRRDIAMGLTRRTDP